MRGECPAVSVTYEVAVSVDNVAVSVEDAYESLIQWNCIFDDDELKEPRSMIRIEKHYTANEIKSFKEYSRKADAYAKLISDANR